LSEKPAARKPLERKIICDLDYPTMVQFRGQICGNCGHLVDHHPITDPPLKD